MKTLQIVDGGLGHVVVDIQGGNRHLEPSMGISITRRARRGKRVKILKLHENGEVHCVGQARTIGRLNRKAWRATNRALHSPRGWLVAETSHD